MTNPEELQVYGRQLKAFWDSGHPNAKRVTEGDLNFANQILAPSGDVLDVPKKAKFDRLLRAAHKIKSILKPAYGVEPESNNLSGDSSHDFPPEWKRSPRAVRAFLRLWRREMRHAAYQASFDNPNLDGIAQDSDSWSEQSLYLDIWKDMDDDMAWDDGWVEDADLCHVCTRRSYKRLFLQGFDFESGYRFATRSLEHVKKFAPSCKFCLMTAVALNIENDLTVRDEDAGMDVRCNELTNSGSLESSVIDFSDLYSGAFKRKAKMSFYLETRFERDIRSRRQSKNFIIADHHIQLSLSSQSENVDSNPSQKLIPEHNSGRLMDETVGFERLRTWVNVSCDSSTIEEAVRNTWLLSHPIRLIDVQEGNLTSFSTYVKYAALTYVWGDSVQVQLSSHTEAEMYHKGWVERVSTELGRTISDAIQVCRAVNLRYLWVDSLCIKQDDYEDKQNQINQMHSIYGLANLTIVQASADLATNSNTPLKGLLPGTRNVKQMQSEIQGQKIILTCRPPFSTAIKMSKWFSRAWTMQEQYLSHRLLYFTDHQVFFVSKKRDFFCEDTVFEHEREGVQACCRSSVSGQDFDWDFNPFTNKIYDTRAEALFSLISQYTGRQLSHQSDALAAIQALQSDFLNDLGPRSAGFLSYVFDYSLCWSPCSVGVTMKRRENFPSWSWAGWQGNVCFFLDADPQRSRTGYQLAGKPINPHFTGFSLIVNKDNTCASMLGITHNAILSHFLSNLPPEELQQQPYRHEGMIFSPQAASETELNNYYYKLLGHETDSRRSPNERSDLHLYFTTSMARLRILLTESPILLGADGHPGGQEGRGRREARHTGNFYALDLPPSILSRNFAKIAEKAEVNATSHRWLGKAHGIFPTSIAVCKDWRDSQPPELDVDFIAVRTMIEWKQDDPDPRRPVEAVTLTYLNLVPIVWEMSRACGCCEVKHLVARRIANIAVLTMDWEECIEDWIMLGAKQKFIVLT